MDCAISLPPSFDNDPMVVAARPRAMCRVARFDLGPFGTAPCRGARKSLAERAVWNVPRQTGPAILDRAPREGRGQGAEGVDHAEMGSGAGGRGGARARLGG